jgi:hypothetical protein
VCARCGVEKPEEEFYRRSERKCGRQYACKECVHAARVANARNIASKVCTRCGVEKPNEDFDRRWKGTDARQPACKECVRIARRVAYHANPEKFRAENRARYAKDRERRAAMEREYRRANPERYRAKCRAWRLANPERVRANALRARTSITLSDYDRMFREQDGRCAICRRPETVVEPRTGAPKRLSIDHDHACCSGDRRACGRCVRGLLCSRCNAALGFLGDDPDFLEAGARYLREHARRQSGADEAVGGPAGGPTCTTPDASKEVA